MQSLGLTKGKTDFAESLGIDPATLSRTFNKKEVSRNILVKLETLFPGHLAEVNNQLRVTSTEKDLHTRVYMLDAKIDVVLYALSELLAERRQRDPELIRRELQELVLNNYRAIEQQLSHP